MPVLPTAKAGETQRVRIRLFQEHLGYVQQAFLTDFQAQCEISNFNNWIKRKACLEFGIFLEARDDLKVLQALLEARYYENVSEWIKECMRKEMMIANGQMPNQSEPLKAD